MLNSSPPSDSARDLCCFETSVATYPSLEGGVPRVAKKGFPHAASLSSVPLATSQGLGCS